MSLEPKQADDDNNDINKSKMRKHGNEVNVKLLIRLELLDINSRE